MSLVKSSFVLAISNVVAMACQVFTISLYARHFPEAGLTTYFLAMALAALLTPCLSFGVNDGILYYIGRNRDDVAMSMRILGTALSFYLCIGLAAFACLAFASGMLSRLFFSEPDKGALVGVVAFLTLSRFSFGGIFRYMTATRRVILPGVLQVMVLGISPLAVIAVARPLDVKWLLLETAVATLVIWIVFFLVEVARCRKQSKASLMPSMPTLRLLVGYGIQRVPTILGISLVLSSPVLIAKRLHLSSTDVIVIGGCMALLRMLGITNRLMTAIVLPRISWAQANKPRLLSKVMWILLVFAFFVAITVSMGFLATGDTVLRLWLHRSSLGSSGLTVSLWLSAMPFVMVYFLRPTIDALHFRAYNTLNVLIAMLLMGAAILLGHFVFHSNNPIGNGVLFASCCLCGLSVCTVRKLTKDMFIPKIGIFSSRLWIAVIGSVLLVSVAIAIRYYTNVGYLNAFPGIVIMGIVAVGYLATATLFLRHPYFSEFQKEKD